MKWINKHKQYFRIAYLIFLVIAISGPWFFDRINVPSPYTCSAPNMRLDDKFCGAPMSIAWLFPSVLGELPYIATGLAKGSLGLADASWLLLFRSLFLLLSLPLFSTTILILRNDYRRWHLLHLMVLTLGIGMSGWIAWFDYSRASWVLWGLWLYIGLAISMWVLEARLLRGSRKLL